jgi:serine-type D-Ala-D-Ala carboxypeptidase/endopeptidase
VQDRTLLFIASASLLLIGCGGGGDSDPAPVPPSDRFAQVDAAARAAYEQQGIPGMGLAVYDRSGTLVFRQMYGDFNADRRVAIASASKMVAGTVIFRLIDAGYLSLDSTTAEVLGWTGDKGAITLRHLLSFTSGLPREHLCTIQVNIELADCVGVIQQQSLIAPPGTLFEYGSTHLHVAARMAEVQVGAAWNDIFRTQLADPLNLDGAEFYTHPRQGEGTANPLIAGGMRASMNEYARILQLVFDKGVWQGATLIDLPNFELQTREPYPDASVGNTPRPQLTDSSHYGLTAWLECSTPAEGCEQLSSPGAFGFTPWIDREAGYFAILGMELDRSDSGVVGFAVDLKQELAPLIIQAL